MSTVDRLTLTLARICRTTRASARNALMVVGAGRPGAWLWTAHHFDEPPQFGVFAKLHSVRMKPFG